MLWQMYSSPPSDLQRQQRLICVWLQHFLPIPWLQSWHEATEAQSVGGATSTSTCSGLTQLVSHASPCSDTSCSESVSVLQSYRLWASSGSTLEAPVSGHKQIFSLAAEKASSVTIWNVLIRVSFSCDYNMAWWTVPNAGLAISKKHFALLFCLNWETLIAFHCLLALLQYWCGSIMCLFSSSWKRVRAARCNLLTKSVSYAILVRLGLRIRKEHVPRRCDGVWWNRMVESGRCGREMATCGSAAMSPDGTSRAETAKPFLIFVFSKSRRLDHHLLIFFLLIFLAVDFWPVLWGN